jgi:hypothetical protein
MTDVVHVKRDDLRRLVTVLVDAQDALEDWAAFGKVVAPNDDLARDLKRLEDGEALVRHVMAVNVVEEFNGPFCAACGRLRDAK